MIVYMRRRQFDVEGQQHFPQHTYLSPYVPEITQRELGLFLLHDKYDPDEFIRNAPRHSEALEYVKNRTAVFKQALASLGESEREILIAYTHGVRLGDRKTLLTSNCVIATPLDRYNARKAFEQEVYRISNAILENDETI